MGGGGEGGEGEGVKFVRGEGKKVEKGRKRRDKKED